MSREIEVRRHKIDYEGYSWTVELWPSKVVVFATHPSIKGNAYDFTINNGDWQLAQSERDFVVYLLNECIKSMKAGVRRP